MTRTGYLDLEPPNLPNFENFFFHTISIKKIYMVIRYMKVQSTISVKISTKVTFGHFLGCHTIF